MSYHQIIGSIYTPQWYDRGWFEIQMRDYLNVKYDKPGQPGDPHKWEREEWLPETEED